MPTRRPDSPNVAPWRLRLHEIIFEADTPIGAAFDILLLAAIGASVLCVLLESVGAIALRYERALVLAEWVFTILFTIEYVLRLICVRRPLRYARSFYGLVDLLAIIPTYLGLLPFVGDAHSLLVIRALRLLRIFRIFKLARYLSEAKALRRAVWASRAKVTVFLAAVLIVVVIMGAAMHLVEGSVNPAFSSIPESMYWAIVTMTTVGYGDITPATGLGQFLAALIMVLGYSFIIIPTGIISAELATAAIQPVSTQACPHCSLEGHSKNAKFCKFCGEALNPNSD
ncbi:MAG: ion transporter [Planctomycetes bacterium]|nr:ion transporter [Planctomycetota bacterium]